jgi:hypothetical protein
MGDQPWVEAEPLPELRPLYALSTDAPRRPCRDVGQVIPLMGLQVRVIDPQTASNTLEGLHLRRQPCSRQATITGAKKNKQRDRNTFWPRSVEQSAMASLGNFDKGLDQEAAIRQQPYLMHSPNQLRGR